MRKTSKALGIVMSSLKLVFNDNEMKMIETLKEEYGLKQTTELIRFIIKSHYKRVIEKEKKDTSVSPPQQT